MGGKEEKGTRRFRPSNWICFIWKIKIWWNWQVSTRIPSPWLFPFTVSIKYMARSWTWEYFCSFQPMYHTGLVKLPVRQLVFWIQVVHSHLFFLSIQRQNVSSLKSNDNAKITLWTVPKPAQLLNHASFNTSSAVGRDSGLNLKIERRSLNISIMSPSEYVSPYTCVTCFNRFCHSASAASCETANTQISL